MKLRWEIFRIVELAPICFIIYEASNKIKNRLSTDVISFFLSTHVQFLERKCSVSLASGAQSHGFASKLWLLGAAEKLLAIWWVCWV